jgi:hypothetical protein
MCSNFGSHHQPSRTPCEPESQRYALRRLFAYLRSRFRTRPMKLKAIDHRPEALNLPRIRSK